MLARLRSFLGAWTRRDRFEDALDDEVRFHLEACTEELVRAGVPGHEAARRARVQFGSYPMFRDLQRGQDVFTDIAAHRDFGVHVGYGGRTIEGRGLLVSGSYFPVLGLAPAAGRLPGPEVDVPIGLRMALGADAARLRAMVLGQVGRMTLAGGALGLVAALGIARVAQSMLYEVEGLPPAVVAAVVLSLAAVALGAALVPAHRAARVDPMEALRHR